MCRYYSLFISQVTYFSHVLRARGYSFSPFRFLSWSISEYVTGDITLSTSENAPFITTAYTLGTLHSLLSFHDILRMFGHMLFVGQTFFKQE